MSLAATINGSVKGGISTLNEHKTDRIYNYMVSKKTESDFKIQSRVKLLVSQIFSHIKKNDGFSD